MSHRMKYVNVYELTQEYGGPEEGGWWYYRLTPIHHLSRRLRRWRQAHRLAERIQERLNHEATGASRILGGNPGDLDSTEDFDPNDMTGVQTGVDYEVRVEANPAQVYPKQRPHYE